MGTILVLRPGALGDALLTVPLAEALMARGAARVVMLGSPTSWGFLRADAALEVRDFDGRAWSGLFGQERRPGPRAQALLAEVDGALVLLGRGRGAVAAALRAAGVRRVAGSAPAPPEGEQSARRSHPDARPSRKRAGREAGVSPRSFSAPWPPGPAHAARRLMTALPALDGGGEAVWPAAPLALAAHPLLRPEPAEIAQALRHLALAAPPPGGILALHPGSGGAAKCWPPERFAALAAAAATRWGVLPVFLVGPADAATWRAVQASLPPAVAALALVERPLREVLALLSLARAYIGNDSGISHLAGRACPTLVLFGPSDPEVWHPLGPSVVVLSAGRRLLVHIRPETALAALGRFLA